MQALVNQGVKPEDISLVPLNMAEVDPFTKIIKHFHDKTNDQVQKDDLIISIAQMNILNQDQTSQSTTATTEKTVTEISSAPIATSITPSQSVSVIVNNNKRKLIVPAVAGSSDDQSTQLYTSSMGYDNKKMRRVQNKNSSRCQNSMSSTSTVSSNYNKGRK